MNKRELRQLLCSMLLGDGFIKQKTKTAAPQFGFRHSIAQQEYAIWKAKQIDRIFEQKKLPRRCRVVMGRSTDSKGKYHNLIDVQLAWADYMRLLRKRTYNNSGDKKVDYLLSQCQTPKHLAIWFMDDGSEYNQKKKHRDGTMYYGKPILYLHTCSFTDGQVNLIVQWFKQMYDVEPQITRTSTKQGRQPRLRFRTKDSIKLFNLIRPYVAQFEVMKRKFSGCFEKY